MKKEEQIRMLLHPEQHTDKQFDQMLDEVNVPMPDANEEWERFRHSHLQRRSKGWMQVAASIVGVLMLSGIAYATINHFIMEKGRPWCGDGPHEENPCDI